MLAEALEGLADQLETITGLRVYDFVPEQINPPAAVLSLGAGLYDQDMDGAVTFNVAVLILVSEGQGAERAQAAFQQYLDPTGDASVRAAVYALANLGGAVDDAHLLGWDDPKTFEVGGISYAGCELTVELLVGI